MLSDSYTYRLIAGFTGVAAAEGRASLIGRALTAVLVFLARLARGSGLFSLDSGRSRPLDQPGGNWTGRLASGTYRRTRAFASGSFLGRWSRVALAAAPEAALARHGTRLLGAFLAGGGAGRLLLVVVDGLWTPHTILSLALGALALLAGSFFIWRGGSVVAAWHASRTRTVGSFFWRATSGAAKAEADLSAVGPSPGTSAEDSTGSRLLVAIAAAVAVVSAFIGGVYWETSGLLVAAAGVAFFLVGLVLYRPQALLVVLAAFPWLDWAARQSLGGLGALWDELLLLAALALLGYAAFFTRQVQLRTVPITLPLLVALAAAVASQTVSNVPGDVGLFALRVTFQPLLFYFLGYLLPRDRRWVRWAVTVFLGASLLLALHGIYQYLTGAPMPASWIDQHETTIGTRAYSIILNPNGLGAFLLLGALVSVSLALAPLPRIYRVSMLLLAGVLAAGIAVTFSRGAWLALILGGFALAALAYRRLFVGLLVGALLSPVIIPRAFLDRLTFAFSDRYIAQSLRAGRLLMWDISLKRIAADPFFGSGLGTFGGTAAVTFGYHGLWVDNFYFQLAAEGGLILFVAFMWLLLRAGKGLVAATIDQTDPYLRALSAGVFAGFVAVLLANFTASVWETLAVGAGFWFLAGLASRPPDEPLPAREAAGS